MEHPVLTRFRAARMWLSVRIPFLGHLAMRLTARLATPADGVSTMAVTPDAVVVIDPQFAAELTEGGFRAVVCHELLHVALSFWARCGTRNRMLFNVAHDIVINNMLDVWGEDHGEAFRLPDDALRDVELGHLSAEMVYDALLRGVQPRGTLRHVMRDGECRSGDARDGLAGDCRADLASTTEGRATARGDAAAARRLQREWSRALATAHQVHGFSLPSHRVPHVLQEAVEPLGSARVSWARVLSAWVGEHALGSDWSWTRPSRRSESAGELLPGVVRTSGPPVIILWDTSGSMLGEVEAVFTEVRAIVDDLGLRVRVIVCDEDVRADVPDLDTAAEILLRLEGGGGSSFEPAFERLEQEGADGLVVAFTDGYIEVPSAAPPLLRGVLWVLTSKSCPPAAWGDVVRVDRSS